MLFPLFWCMEIKRVVAIEMPPFTDKSAYGLDALYDIILIGFLVLLLHGE